MSQLFQVVSPGGTYYQIEFDGKTYTVERQQKNLKTGEPYWKPVDAPYFGHLPNACKRLLEIGLAEQDHQQVMTLIWRMENWTKRIEAAVAAMEAARAPTP